MRSSRLQEWPEWAARYYWLLRANTSNLEMKARLLQSRGFDAQNTPLLERGLPDLKRLARSIRLYALELQQARDGDRWPNWANAAHECALHQAEIIERKLAHAENHLQRNYWELAEARLRECILLAQEILIAVMTGPVPRMSETDVFVIRNVEALQANEWMKQLGITGPGDS